MRMCLCVCMRLSCLVLFQIHAYNLIQGYPAVASFLIPILRTYIGQKWISLYNSTYVFICMMTTEKETQISIY